MNPETNPYRSPEHAVDRYLSPDNASRSVDVFAIVAWPVVFGLNTITPLMFAWGMVQSGWGGVAAAVVLLLISGWALCYFRAAIARRLLLGSAIVAVTQVFPMLQVICGMVALMIAADVLGVEPGGRPNRPIATDLGSFVITLLVGVMLLSIAAMISASLRFILPQQRSSHDAPPA